MSMRSDTLSNLRPSSPAHGDGRLQRTSSHELLTAHPLLSPGPSSLSVSTSVGGAPANSNSTLHSSPESTRIASGSTQVSAPKYLPYTPRQARAVTGSATTGTASSPVSVSPQQQHVGGSPSATSRLQLQNLKAVAQNHGLDVGCLGWVMLEELVGGLDHASAWSELWGMLATGKATLLLPTEQASSHEAITPEMMKDHIIFCNGSARNDAPVVTLSGLRGTIDESALKFQSTLATESKSFKALSNPSTRSSALLTLPPLPIPFNPSANYPHVLVQAFIPFLPIPPRSVTPPKPPLPPRPGSKPVVTPNVSRLSNPFASFFSKPSTPSSPASTPHLLPDAQPIDHVVEVSAFTIEQPIVRRNISKALTKCVKSEIKDMLAGSPTWVVERTNSFSASLLPFPKPFQILKENTDGSQGSSDQNSIVSVSANNDTAEEVSQAFQNFYDALEEELKSEGSPSMLRRKDDKHDEEEKRKEQDEHDKKVQDILEKVERTLTCVFYNRLFGPSDSDDASHDETLSSRIAALNMLELSLEHLGVDVGDSKNDVDRIVSACGETISQLSVARCPADKAAIMIASHRIIVDGLSRLPPLRLKSEEQIDEDRTPQAPAFDHDVQNSVGTAERDSSLSFPKLTVSPDPSSPPSDYSRLEESGTSETIRADALEDDGISSSSIPSSLSQANVVEAPLLTVSPPKTPTPVSGDILLPLIIFSVVKANPPQLVSHLLFTQRFRNQSVGGEESYCLINLMAVVEFLENVDLGALGLKESEKKVMSAADLTPIPLAHLTGDKSAASTPGIPAGFRGRVEQQVDALAGSANKVFSGVVDSGFGVFRSLLPATPGEFSNLTSSTDGAQETAWNSIRPGFGLLRRESGFSIASLAASLPGRDRGRSFASSHNPKEEEGQEMVESRPVSVRSMILDHEGVELEGNASTEGSEESGDGNEDEDEDDEDEDARHDMRSIRSFESMMSGRIQSKRTENAKKERMSLSDRLAHMSRLTKGSKSHSLEVSAHQGSPPPRSSALLSARELNRFDTPMSSRTSSPVLGGRSFHVAPPNRRFLECTADDLKMSEIPELLQEYQRLVENVRSMGAFDEHS